MYKMKATKFKKPEKLQKLPSQNFGCTSIFSSLKREKKRVLGLKLYST